jgi:hypothetical protein
LKSLDGGHWYSLLSAFIALVGIWLSVTAIAALERLWVWHNTYFEKSCEIEGKIEEFCNRNGIKELLPLPLISINKERPVNTTISEFSAEDNTVNNLLLFIFRPFVYILYPKRYKIAIQRLKKRTTHSFMFIFIVACFVLLTISLIRSAPVYEIIENYIHAIL